MSVGERHATIRVEEGNSLSTLIKFPSRRLSSLVSAIRAVELTKISRKSGDSSLAMARRVRGDRCVQRRTFEMMVRANQPS